MRRFVSLGALATIALVTLTGCGGEKPVAPEVQEKRLKDAEASMDKGMDAMKGMKNIKR